MLTAWRHWRLSSWQPYNRRVSMLTAWRHRRLSSRQPYNTERSACWLPEGIEGCHHDSLTTEMSACWLPEGIGGCHQDILTTESRHADCLKALKAVIRTALQQKGWHADWLFITQGIEGCHPSMLSMPQVMSKQLKWWPFFNSNISPGLFSTWQTIY